MKQILLLLAFLVITAFTPVVAQYNSILPASWPSLVGFWEFENAASLTTATVGANLSLTGSETQVSGPSPSDFASRILPGSYYGVVFPFAANGGGAYINKYSIVIDFKAPNIKMHNDDVGQYISFLQTSNTNSNGYDIGLYQTGEFYVNGKPSGKRQLLPNQWYRLVISVDLGNAINLYLDGQLVYSVNSPAGDRDGVLALYPFSSGKKTLFFADNAGNDGEIHVSSLGIFNKPLNSAEAFSLGGFAHVEGNPDFCPKAIAYLINSCTNYEGYNEYFMFSTGTADYDLNQLRLRWDTQQWGVAQGYNASLSGSPSTIDCYYQNCKNDLNSHTFVNDPARVALFNTTTASNAVAGNCSPCLSPPASGIIPANSIVFAFAAICPDASCSNVTPIDFSSYCALGIPIYIVSIYNNNSNGRNWNNASSHPDGAATFAASFDGLGHTCQDISTTQQVDSPTNNLIALSTQNNTPGANDGEGIKFSGAYTGDEFVYPAGNCNFIALETTWLKTEYYKKEDQVYICWLVNETSATHHYTVELSEDGITWIEKGHTVNFSGEGVKNYCTSYPFVNNEEFLYCRIKSISPDGITSYSRILSIFDQGKLLYNVSPNPSSDLFEIYFTSGKAIDTATVYLSCRNMQGIEVYNLKTSGANFKIDASYWPAGTYFLTITDNQTSVTKKIVKD